MIVLPNTSFQSVKETIFLKFSTDTSSMIRVDTFVFGHWSLVVYFGIQDCKYWNMFTYAEFDYIVL